MKIFIRENFKEGRIGAGRNNKSFKGWCIRLLGSWSNHNMMSAIDKEGRFGFNEQEPPFSQHTTLDEYERLMNEEGYEVRIYELVEANDDEMKAMAHWYTLNYLGEKYPKTANMILLGSKLVNYFADRFDIVPNMRLTWCTQRVIDSVFAIKHDILWGEGRQFRKILWTPKTIEKRVKQGLLREVTNQWIKEVDDATV